MLDRVDQFLDLVDPSIPIMGTKTKTIRCFLAQALEAIPVVLEGADEIVELVIVEIQVQMLARSAVHRQFL